MTEKQRALRNNLLSKIHLHIFYKEAFRVGAWQEFLKNNFGVESSAKLSIKELLILLDMMNGKEVATNLVDYKGRRVVDKKLSTKSQIIKCLSLKDELGWKTWEFRQFVLKQINVMLWNDEMINSLSKQNLTKLISVMSKIKTWKENKDDMS